MGYGRFAFSCTQFRSLNLVSSVSGFPKHHKCALGLRRGSYTGKIPLIDGRNVLDLRNNSLVNRSIKLCCLGLDVDWTPAWRGLQVFRSPRRYLGMDAMDPEAVHGFR